MMGAINTSLFEQRVKWEMQYLLLTKPLRWLLENRDYKKERTRKMCVAVRYQLVVAELVAKIVLCATKPGLSSRNAMKSINSFGEVSNETMGI
jgi:hypothetical protein